MYNDQFSIRIIKFSLNIMIFICKNICLKIPNTAKMTYLKAISEKK